MAVKTPVKATFTGSDVTGLAEYQAADFIGVADGGTGAVTFSSGILKADGTNAFTTVTAPSGTIVGTSDTQTLTNKTIDASNNTISNIGVSSLTTSSFTLVDDSSTSTTISLGETLKIAGTSNEVNTSISGDTVTIGLPDSVSITSNLTVGGNLTVNGTTTTVNSTTIEITNSFTFEGSTADAYETVLGVVDPTADRTINLPNASGTIVLQDSTDTLTNKTINSASNTITITESNISDLQSYILANSTDTLTNKTINADNNTITNIGDSELSSGISATKLADGSVSNTEFQYLNGVTSAIQTQLDAKASTAFAIAQAVALG